MDAGEGVTLSPQGENPMDTVVESILQMFIMTLGAFADIWVEIHETKYVLIGEAP